uniref:Uncharacterized protein n=1 Tax=Caenorhabditis japonica TaxID=281687 RepID=A0A8R1I1M3_CAEJA
MLRTVQLQNYSMNTNHKKCTFHPGVCHRTRILWRGLDDVTVTCAFPSDQKAPHGKTYEPRIRRQERH